MRLFLKLVAAPALTMLGLLLCSQPSPAEVTLPALISDHMLIQRDMPVRIWGRADAQEEVSIQFLGRSVSTRADALGRWRVYLPPALAGGPYDLTVSGKNRIVVRDVLVGDVWIASGQSNMVWPVSRSDNHEKEIGSANYSQIRLFKVNLKVSELALDDVGGSWNLCSPESVAGFSGVGYFFARHLHQKLGVPMAVIQSAWGGTPVEAWTSRPALAADAALISVFADWAKYLEDYPEAYLRFERRTKDWEAESARAQSSGSKPGPKPAPPIGPGHPWTPSGLFNAMIAPLTRYTIRGAIWYQGENNASSHPRAYLYRRLFQTMIQDWRRAWGQGEFPFLFVQLANFGHAGSASPWPVLRESQTQALGLANSGMAVTIDIGNPDDIHPTNKQDVGLRLALAARSIAYGERLLSSGPLFQQVSREGEALRVWFAHARGGLRAKGGQLKGFEIAGPDARFHPAEARIDGETVVVQSGQVGQPAYVRYGWADSPDCNLHNSEGLPASPFRSSEWPESGSRR